MFAYFKILVVSEYLIVMKIQCLVQNNEDILNW